MASLTSIALKKSIRIRVRVKVGIKVRDRIRVEILGLGHLGYGYWVRIRGKSLVALFSLLGCDGWVCGYWIWLVV